MKHKASRDAHRHAGACRADTDAAAAALQLAEAVRAACLAAARDGYESAGMSGLCLEGRLEMSLDSIRRMDLSEVVAAALATKPSD